MFLKKYKIFFEWIFTIYSLSKHWYYDLYTVFKILFRSVVLEKIDFYLIYAVLKIIRPYDSQPVKTGPSQINITDQVCEDFLTTNMEIF